MKFCPCFIHIFRPIYIKFGTGYIRTDSLSGCEFRQIRQNQRNESHTLLWAVNFCPYFPQLFSDLGDLRYKRSAYNAITPLLGA